MSTYQDGTTLDVVLGQGCNWGYREKGVQPLRRGEVTIRTNENFIVLYMVNFICKQKELLAALC